MRRLLSHRFVTTSIYVETDIFNISKQNCVYKKRCLYSIQINSTVN